MLAPPPHPEGQQYLSSENPVSALSHICIKGAQRHPWTSLDQFWKMSTCHKSRAIWVFLRKSVFLTKKWHFSDFLVGAKEGQNYGQNHRVPYSWLPRVPLCQLKLCWDFGSEVTKSTSQLVHIMHQSILFTCPSYALVHIMHFSILCTSPYYALVRIMHLNSWSSTGKH